MSRSLDQSAMPTDEPTPRSFIDRRAGRFATMDLTCSVGKVIDLSRDGMRVLARHVPKSPLMIEMLYRNEALHLQAEVVWHRRAGMFTKEIGLQFINVSREMVSKLALVAQATSRRSSVR